MQRTAPTRPSVIWELAWRYTKRISTGGRKQTGGRWVTCRGTPRVGAAVSDRHIGAEHGGFYSSNGSYGEFLLVLRDLATQVRGVPY